MSHLLSHPAVLLCALAVATCAFPEFVTITRAVCGCVFECPRGSVLNICGFIQAVGCRALRCPCSPQRSVGLLNSADSCWAVCRCGLSSVTWPPSIWVISARPSNARWIDSLGAAQTGAVGTRDRPTLSHPRGAAAESGHSRTGEPKPPSGVSRRCAAWKSPPAGLRRRSVPASKKPHRCCSACRCM
jgi:hypothetical protein